jgi:uncharacterized protein CbrC (UPF0167 family)
MLKTIVEAFIAACEAYCTHIAHVQWKSVDDIEDEIDSISESGLDAGTKLRIKRLLIRKKRHIERLESLRSGSDPSDQGT